MNIGLKFLQSTLRVEVNRSNQRIKLYQSNQKVSAKRRLMQGLHRLEKYLNLEGFLEKSLKIKSALKSTGKSLKCLEKSFNSGIFCRT